MASTYSPNLRLELIGTGEQQGTWGSTTNTNLGTLIEEAIGGYTSVTVSDAGDTTLTTNNGSADQARNMVLNLTGTIGAARNVIVPAIEKVYIVKNATTGGFAVTVKVSGQTGVSVPNGSTYILYVDGTDVRQTVEIGSLGVQNASNVSITGGTISGLSNLSVANATVATQVRTNLSAAGSGVNTDITSVYLDNTGLKLKDTNASHGLIIAPGSDLSADRTLTVTTGDAARTVTISGNATISQDYSTTGNPQFATVELGNASDTTLSRVSAGIVAVEGSTIARITDVVGQQTIWVPAGAMTARTTNGAASGTVETSTNKVMLKTLDFDTTTQEFAQFAIQMPKGWDESTLICQFVWSHPSTTTNFGVVWAVEAVGLADDDAADSAFGTAVTATDTGGTTNDVYISPETGAMTVAGSPGPEEWVVFQVKRNVSDGSDNMAVDARLHGVRIHYTTDAAKDD
jgi:hypothetical protein